MAQTYLTKTSPTAGNRTKGTISVWIKRSGLGANQWIYTDYYSSDNYAGIRFGSNDTLGVYSVGGGSAQMNVNTNRVFRDTSAWYNLCVAWDTTDGTAADRIKVYVNGERETFSGSPTYPTSSQDIMFSIGGSYPIVIGRRGDNAEYFNGSMSHFHRVDNQALAPTVFGQYDANGVWKINTSPSITYTGSSDYNFFILKDGNSVTDQSGQSNNLTVGYGTLTKTEDNPSNVFNVWNALVSYPTYPNSLSNGNTTITANANATQGSTSPGTIGVSSGKYYFEFKVTTSTMNNSSIGMCKADMNFNYQADAYPYNASLGNNGIHYVGDGTIYVNGSSAGNQGAWSQNDIIGLAVDLDNGNIAFTKNGSAVYTSSNGSLISGQEYTPAFYGYGSLSGSANFGNGYFGTTAVSSAGTNASGNGIFEYDVPTGYTALSTKGLNL